MFISFSKLASKSSRRLSSLQKEIVNQIYLSLISKEKGVQVFEPGRIFAPWEHFLKRDLVQIHDAIVWHRVNIKLISQKGFGHFALVEGCFNSIGELARIFSQKLQLDSRYPVLIGSESSWPVRTYSSVYDWCVILIQDSFVGCKSLNKPEFCVLVVIDHTHTFPRILDLRVFWITYKHVEFLINKSVSILQENYLLYWFDGTFGRRALAGTGL